MSAIAVGEITIIDLHDEDVHIGTTAPVDLKDGRLWLDTSTVPNVMKRWDAATQKWVKASPTEASDIGAETPSGAQDKADGARDAAKTYAGDILKDLADGKYANGSFIDETKITSPTVISPNVVGLQGTFADLLAGDPFGARLELGEDDGEPFLEAYDDDELRVKLLQDSLEFLARGLTGGKLEAEYFGAGGQSVAGLLLSSDYSIKMQAAYYAWMETYGAAVQCAGESVGIWADAGIGLLAPRIDISGDLYYDNNKAAIIIEEGRNAYGSYVRWSNGLQIVLLSDITLTTAASTHLQATNIPFPANFLTTQPSTSRGIVTFSSSTAPGFSWSKARSAGTGSVAGSNLSYVRLHGVGFATPDNAVVCVLCYGWWK